MLVDIIIIVFLMVAAISLIIAEVFLLPGITIAGIGGGILAIGGIVFAYSVSATTGNITLGASIVTFSGTFLWLLRSNSFSRVSLKADIESTVESPRDMDLKVGDEGISLSRLAPIGKARFNNITVEAKSINDFIDENTPVVIIRIDGYNVVVENKDSTNNINS